MKSAACFSSPGSLSMKSWHLLILPLSLPIALALAVNGLSMNPAQASPAHSVQSQTSPGLVTSVLSGAEAGAKDGRPLIENMLKAAESYSDYVFEFEMTAYKNGTTVERGKFYFKKPRLIRLEELGPFRKGSVAVLTASGTVKGHTGGGLGFLTVDLSPRSSLLRSANGYPMVDSDLTSLAQALKKFVEEGKVAFMAENQTTTAGGTRVEMLEIYTAQNGPIYKRVAVDAKTLLPVEWWDYENGKLVSHSTWDKFQGNIGLNDDTFTIRGASK